MIKKIEVVHETRQAYGIVKDKGEKYKYKKCIYYFAGRYENYCEDCIDEIVEDRKRTGKCTEYFFEFSAEYEDFLFCDKCGKIIECSILWTDQEMEHWLNFDDNELNNSLQNCNDSYCLMKIFDPTYGSQEEYPEKTLLLAKKVINIQQRKEGLQI